MHACLRVTMISMAVLRSSIRFFVDCFNPGLMQYKSK